MNRHQKDAHKQNTDSGEPFPFTVHPHRIAGGSILPRVVAFCSSDRSPATCANDAACSTFGTATSSAGSSSREFSSFCCLQTHKKHPMQAIIRKHMRAPHVLSTQVFL